MRQSLFKANMPASFRRLYRSPIFIAVAVFVFRIAGLFLTLRWRPWVVVNPLFSGGEVTSVARSIVSGKGFSNPLGLIQTGPTAWLCPVYPYIVAGVFKLCGIHSVRSQLILLSLNCAFAGFTIFPIYAIARRTFGTDVAVLASWVWFVLPSTWHIPIKMAWDSTVDALSLAVIFWATLAIRSNRRLSIWAAYGVLWAVGALTNASILSLVPFLFGWLLWELREQSASRLKFLATAILFLALGIAPWTLRNYLVFGKFVPIRSNFGLLIWFGNHPGAQGIDATLSPFGNPQEAAIYARMGEIAYMTAKRHEAVAFIESHPTRTLGFALHNVWTYWFDVTDRQINPWWGLRYLSTYFISNAVFILCSLAGTGFALRSRLPEAPLYLAVLLFFPLVHYLTKPAVRFRFAIEPVLTVLAAYGASCIFNWAIRRWPYRGIIDASAAPHTEDIV